MKKYIAIGFLVCVYFALAWAVPIWCTGYINDSWIMRVLIFHAMAIGFVTFVFATGWAVKQVCK